MVSGTRMLAVNSLGLVDWRLGPVWIRLIWCIPGMLDRIGAWRVRWRGQGPGLFVVLLKP